MNAEQKHVRSARLLIARAQRDLDRGDRLDAMDSLTFAINYLRKSRAATDRRVLREGRALHAKAGA